MVNVALVIRVFVLFPSRIGANEWKQYFHVTHIGRTLVIKPTWEKYTSKAGEHIIEIDPGMAFGTGTHHTTCMCMERLEKVLRTDMEVFDVGTGSGILGYCCC